MPHAACRTPPTRGCRRPDALCGRSPEVACRWEPTRTSSPNTYLPGARILPHLPYPAAPHRQGTCPPGSLHVLFPPRDTDRLATAHPRVTGVSRAASPRVSIPHNSEEGERGEEEERGNTNQPPRRRLLATRGAYPGLLPPCLPAGPSPDEGRRGSPPSPTPRLPAPPLAGTGYKGGQTRQLPCDRFLQPTNPYNRSRALPPASSIPATSRLAVSGSLPSYKSYAISFEPTPDNYTRPPLKPPVPQATTPISYRYLGADTSIIYPTGPLPLESAAQMMGVAQIFPEKIEPSVYLNPACLPGGG